MLWPAGSTTAPGTPHFGNIPNPTSAEKEEDREWTPMDANGREFPVLECIAVHHQLKDDTYKQLPDFLIKTRAPNK